MKYEAPKITDLGDAENVILGNQKIQLDADNQTPLS